MIEDFFDLKIATIGPWEAPPPEAHLVRIENPPPDEVARRVAEGWFFKPIWVTYAIPVPASLDEYIDRAFRSRLRNKPRNLLRDVPKRYRFEIEPAGAALDRFRDLYLRTVVGKPRGKDRLAEDTSGFGRGWSIYGLYDADALVAGVLVHSSKYLLQVGYGAFDPEHRKAFDLEHFLLMQVLRQCIERGHRAMSLGMDTNRYGHHLSLRLAAYKLRIGFTPMAYEPGGRELTLFQRFDVFEEGLFFWAYEGTSLCGHLFSRGEPDARPFEHRGGPPIRTHQIPPSP